MEMGGVGNRYTIRVAMSVKKRRGQKAQSHGRRGLSPLDHRAASHPPKIWKGKSIRTAIARSSRPKPFSTNLSEVTASLAWKPTFAKICMTMSDCTSALDRISLIWWRKWRARTYVSVCKSPIWLYRRFWCSFRPPRVLWPKMNVKTHPEQRSVEIYLCLKKDKPERNEEANYTPETKICA